MDAETQNLPVIDCDIHSVVPSIEALIPYLPDHWQEYVTQSDLKGPPPTLYSPPALTEARPQTRPEGDRPPGSDFDTLKSQTLDRHNLEIGMLNCAYAVESVRNPYGAAAFAAAVNDWQRAEWLDRDSRLRASLVVPSQDPELAVREIERLGDHPGFVQVFLPVRSANLYGTRQFHPIYKAAAERELVIGIHFGGSPGAPPTSSGWPSTYIEEYAGMSHIFQSQLISLIVEGVFEAFKTLKIALIASGVTWLPSLMWRLDKEWKGLRREIPWVKRLPSEYIQDRVRLTLQPLDAPPAPDQLRQVIEQIGSDDMLMFSTDYPYQLFESVDEALPPNLAPDLKRKILADNARAIYRL